MSIFDDNHDDTIEKCTNSIHTKLFWGFVTKFCQFYRALIKYLSFSHVMEGDQWIFAKEVFI